MTLHPAIQPDDDFLLDDGLPCLRRTGKLYYLGDMQPRVLEACNRVSISFDQLAEKLGIARPTLVLILKGYDPVPLPLKSMIDRLVSQVGLLQPATSYCEIPAAYMPANESAARAEDAAAQPAAPVSTTIQAIPAPQVPRADDADLPPITVVAEEVPADAVIIPQVVALDRPAAARPPAPRIPEVAVPPAPTTFAATLAGFTPGLRRVPRSRASREQL